MFRWFDCVQRVGAAARDQHRLVDVSNDPRPRRVADDHELASRRQIPIAEVRTQEIGIEGIVRG
jgi:hypothetical protein